jgi:hypothetical protein
MIFQFQGNPKIAAIYFYFDFNDKEKQNLENLLSSLLAQLASQSSKHISTVMKDLYSSSKSNRDRPSPPTSDAMYSTLVTLVSEFDQVYICLDVLDECVERNRMVNLFERIKREELACLHILATSRREWDLEPLAEISSECINIRSAVVDADIQIYLKDQLNNDRVLKKRPKLVKEMIMEALTKDAKGMYGTIPST